MAELWPSAFDVLASVKVGALKPGDEYYKEAMKYITENYDNIMQTIQAQNAQPEAPSQQQTPTQASSPA